MKRYFGAFLALILSLTLCGCSQLYHYLEEQLDPADTVVVLTTPTPPDFTDLNAAVLEQHQSDFRYRRIASESAAAQFSAFSTAAKDPSTAALVVELSSRVYAEAMIETAREHALPLVFCGKKPDLAAMNAYENCWYVGFEPALAAELQAKLITDAYRADFLTDQSGDYKLNTLTVTASGSLAYLPENYAGSLMRNIELAGIHLGLAAEPVSAANTDELYQRLAELLLPQQPSAGLSEADVPLEPTAPAAHTEILLCGDTTASAAVLQLLPALQNAAAEETLASLATPDRPYYVVCCGINDAVETAVKEGVFLGAVGRDTEACTKAILTLCENLARREAITKNNVFYFEHGKYLMMDYQVISAVPEAEQ